MAGFCRGISAGAALFPVLAAIRGLDEGVTALCACGAANRTNLPVIARVCRISRAVGVRAAYRKGPGFADGVCIIFNSTTIIILIAKQFSRDLKRVLLAWGEVLESNILSGI